MKDTVFIGWTTDSSIAIKVKDLIEKESFAGVVGGDYEGNPKELNQGKTINDRIVKQMNHCDQGILIFSKPVVKEGEQAPKNVSGNLIYEYGYLHALFGYSSTDEKLVVITIDFNKQEDELLFPSDLRGAWVKNIVTSKLKGDEPLEDKIAKEVTRIFLDNQKKLKNINLFKILDDHHQVEREFEYHESQPAYSDYDFATYILIYAMSGFCFQEHFDHKDKLEQYKPTSASKYVRQASTYARHTLELFCATSPEYDSSRKTYTFNFDNDTLNQFSDFYSDDGKDVIEGLPFLEGSKLRDARMPEDKVSSHKFETLLLAQLQEHMTYVLLLGLHSKMNSKETCEKNARKGINYGLSAIHNLKLLEKEEEFKEYSMLLESYEYKNLSTFYRTVGEDSESLQYRDLSIKMRDNLKRLGSKQGHYRTTLEDYLKLEYYTQLIELVDEYDDEDKDDALRSIGKFIKESEIKNQNRLFMLNMLKEEYKKKTK